MMMTLVPKKMMNLKNRCLAPALARLFKIRTEIKGKKSNIFFI
jgi:hypothetical protein